MMILHLHALLAATAIAATPALALNAEDFHEELYVRRTGKRSESGGAGYAFHFQFTTRWMQNDGDRDFAWQHFNLFPKSFGQAIDTFGVEELRLSFSRGAWDLGNWGYPFESAPSGVELWSVFEDKPVASEFGNDSAWIRVTRHFGGSFCASLEQLGAEQQAATPSLSFGLNSSEEKQEELSLRYGQLPMEVSCTENLTPWLKLLPTRSQAGLARFIVPSRVYSALHHTMTTHVRKICYDEDQRSMERTTLHKSWAGCSAKVAELVQSFTVVFGDEEGASPLELLIGKGKDGRKLGAKGIVASSVATRSLVYVETNIDTSSGQDYDIVSLPFETHQSVHVARFDLKQTSFGGEELEKLSRFGPNQDIPRVEVMRATYGTGQIYGGVTNLMKIDLNGITQAKLRILELVPSYMRIRPSSINLTVEADGRMVQHNSLLTFSRIEGPPGMLEYEADVSGCLSVTVDFRYEFDKAFQKIDAFPPDANRGFDVPATMVVLAKSSQEKFSSESPLLSRLMFLPNVHTRVYSNLLLISMPLPDFSMPFNVITLSSTIIALMFGNVLNAVGRRFNTKKQEKKGSFQRLRSKLQSLKRRFTRTSEKTSE